MTRGLYQTSRQTLLCAAACLALSAETPRIGVQALGSAPTGSMRSQFASDTGYGIGLFAGWEAGPGREFRLAYDGIWYPSSNESASLPGVPATGFGSTDSTHRSRTHSVTAQYLFYPSGDTEGFYWKAGLGAMNYLTRVETTLTFPPAGQTKLTVLEESGTKLACLAGVGCDFSRNWGVLAQYSFLTMNNHTLGAVQAGVAYRF